MRWLNKSLGMAMAALILSGGVHAAELPKVFEVQKFDMQKYAGKVVLVDFWASWCGPCRQSFPWMKALQEKYGPQGLVIAAINVDAEPKDAEKFLKDFAPNFDIYMDPKGGLAELFKVQAMPTSFLVDAGGKAVSRHAGFRKAGQAEYELEIQALLKARGMP